MSIYIELMGGHYRYQIDGVTFERGTLAGAISSIKRAGYRPAFIPVI